MNAIPLQLVITIVGVVCSALASFYGAKISIARVEEKIAAQAETIDDLKARVNRLEGPHFSRGN
jgi:cell division protein FtsL